jgi:protein phosphatase
LPSKNKVTKKRIFEVSAGTDCGCVRTNNEDSFAVDENLGLLVVADGLGGHRAGEVASALACSAILAGKRRGLSIKECIQSANALIHERSASSIAESGMGTTVVAALIGESFLTVAHVGDSRLYRYRLGKLELLTRDHTWVEEQMQSGLMTPEQAQVSEYQNMLTRALGSDVSVAIEVSEQEIWPGDVILLASDGLNRMIPDSEISSVLAVEKKTQLAVSGLIAKAREAGGCDNVTVIVAQFPE